MYNFAELVLVLAIAILGAYMFFQPEKSTKEENRNDEAAVAKTKKSGLVLIIIGLAAACLRIVLFFI